MPIYKPVLQEDGSVKHEFVFRVYNGEDEMRRVYKKDDLVYSLYDINYHYGQEDEGGSGAILDGEDLATDVWGHTSVLNKASFTEEVDGETFTEIYSDWYKALATDESTKDDTGFVDTTINGQLGDMTDIDNKDDYDLYIDLVRTSIVGNRKIRGYYVTASGATYDEAVALSEEIAQEEGAEGITAQKITSPKSSSGGY